MRLLASADWHLGTNYPYAKRDKGGLNSRLVDLYMIWEDDIYGRLYDFWDAAVIPGDWFDTGKLDGATLVISSRIIKLIESHDKPVYILKGNHDEKDKVSTLSQYLSFPLKRAKFIDRHISVICGNVELVFLPWNKDLNILRTQLRQAKTAPKKAPQRYLIAHLPVKGSWYAKTKAAKGITKAYLQLLTSSGTRYFDWIILGHHHKPQILVDKAFYTGSPLQKDFGEANEDHGIYIINPDNGLEFYKSGAPTFVSVDSAEDHDKRDYTNKIVLVNFSSNVFTNQNRPTNEIETVKKKIVDRGAVFVTSKITRPKIQSPLQLQTTATSNKTPEVITEKYIEQTLYKDLAKKPGVEEIKSLATDYLKKAAKGG